MCMEQLNIPIYSEIQSKIQRQVFQLLLKNKKSQTYFQNYFLSGIC